MRSLIENKIRFMFEKEISKDGNKIHSVKLQVQGTRKRRSDSGDNIEENKKEVEKVNKTSSFFHWFLLSYFL